MRLRTLCWLGLALSTIPAVHAQDALPYSPGIVAGFAGSLLFPHDGFRKEIGDRHGGARAFFGLQASPTLAFGFDLSGHTLGGPEETVRLPSGLDVEVATTADIARLGLFGRYGPRLGPVYVYGEALVGLNVVSTRSRVGRPSDQNPGETQQESLAPAAGGSFGVELEIHDLPVAMHVRASHVRGGTAHYLAYDEYAQAFSVRTSGTTASSVSVGLTYNFFRAAQ